MAENKMIEKMAKLMQMSNAVTYEPNARQIELSAQPTREKYYVTADNGHLTIDYTSLGTLLYNAGYRKQEWISVDERLPEPNTNVLIYVFFHNQWQIVKGWLSYCDKKFHISNSDYPSLTDIPVTHWMPLPEPPETKGEN